jgi:hypothetical protein
MGNPGEVLEILNEGREKDTLPRFEGFRELEEELDGLRLGPLAGAFVDAGTVPERGEVANAPAGEQACHKRNAPFC